MFLFKKRKDILSISKNIGVPSKFVLQNNGKYISIFDMIDVNLSINDMWEKIHVLKDIQNKFIRVKLFADSWIYKMGKDAEKYVDEINAFMKVNFENEYIRSAIKIFLTSFEKKLNTGLKDEEKELRYINLAIDFFKKQKTRFSYDIKYSNFVYEYKLKNVFSMENIFNIFDKIKLSKYIPYINLNVDYFVRTKIEKKYKETKKTPKKF